MAFWCEAKERTNINRFSEPFLIVQCRDVRQGDDRTYSGYDHQSARQVTFARYGPYLLVQRVSGDTKCLVQRDERFRHHRNRWIRIRRSCELIPKVRSQLSRRTRRHADAKHLEHAPHMAFKILTHADQPFPSANEDAHAF